MSQATACLYAGSVISRSMKTVAVVSGLPRSGTSLMMRMCSSGGIEAVTDGVRRADDSNPGGYFELEAVKDARGYPSWIEHADGKVVKVVTRHLSSLPCTHNYKVVLMLRNLAECIRSQSKLAQQLAAEQGGQWEDARLYGLYRNHLRDSLQWLRRRPNMSVLQVRYESVLSDPHGQSQRIARFLGKELDIDAMVRVVDASLNHSSGRAAARDHSYTVPPGAFCAADSLENIKAVAFDLDGVIIDSLPVMRVAYAYAFEQVVGRGEPPPFSEYQRHLGRSFPDIMKKLGLPIAMHPVFKAESDRRIEEIRVFPQIRELLLCLRQHGFKLAIATGKDTDRAENILRHLGLRQFFDMVVGSDRIAHPKPAPDMLELIREEFGLEPSNVLFCGDAPVDLRCGRSAGTAVAAALWSDVDLAALQAEVPDLLLSQPMDMLDALGMTPHDAKAAAH